MGIAHSELIREIVKEEEMFSVVYRFFIMIEFSILTF